VAWLAALVSTLALLAASVPAAAAPLLVTKTEDTNDGFCNADCSLREAIIRANTDAVEDVITLPAGTFPVTGTRGEDLAAQGDLDVTQPVIVRGAGAGTVIDAAFADRIFDVRSPVSFTLEAVTLTRGDPGSGGDGLGGAISDRTLGGALVIRDATFTNNRAVRAAANGQGGAIFSVAVDTTIVGSTFTGNIAGGGGQDGFGGAVVVSGDASLAVRDSTLSENTAGGGGGGGTGGAIYTSAQASITIERSVFSGNNAGGGTGGAGFGGGLLIDSSGGLTTISASSFTGNEAGIPGAGGFGAGMVLRANGTEVINTTVSGNTASAPGFLGLGAGLVNETSAPPGLRLVNSTIAGNAAGTDPGDIGGLYVTSRPTTARNTIIALNGTDCDMPIQNSEGNNLESGTACGFTAAGDQQGKDPLLGPLADNGGPTATLALLANSPARNAGSNAGCPGQDQRGIVRPQEGVCDIGAFEFVPPLVEPPADLFAPELTGARVTGVWAVNPRGTREVPVAALTRVRLGASFVYSLSEAARVVFAFERKAKGRRVAGRCRKPTRRNRGRRRCTRFVKAGAFAHQSVAGANRKRFSGRIGQRRLKPARYRVTLRATDEAGNRSAPRRLAFRVVKTPKTR